MPSTNLRMKYLLERPRFELPVSVREDLSARLREARAAPGITKIEIEGIPKWQALCYFADCEKVLLHGTSNPSIELFEPRQNVDSNPFGAQKAVYAASDGLWPMFYAVLDRTDRFSLHNGALRFLDESGTESEPYYFFSIEESALARRAFSPGYVFVLPRESFTRDPDDELWGMRCLAAHWASLVPVRPIAIISIDPEDFPFLSHIRGHNDDLLSARVKENPSGFPWVDEQYM